MVWFQGAVYRRINPSRDIDINARDSFWEQQQVSLIYSCAAFCMCCVGLCEAFFVIKQICGCGFMLTAHSTNRGGGGN